MSQLSGDVISAPRPVPARPAVAGTISRSLRAGAPAIVAGLRGLAVGTLVTVVLIAAFAGLNLHLATPVGDALLGVAIVALPILLVWGALALTGLALRTIVGLVGRRVTRVQSAAPGVRAGIRVVTHPLLVSTIVLAAILWLTPRDGPLSLYRSLAPFEIPVVTGALVGFLAGVGRWAWRTPPSTRARRVVATAALVPALVIGTGVTGWAVYPGSGDPIVREDAAALATIPQLDLADPSLPGRYEVTHATYGSGNVWRRPEFGPDADWSTPTVDASSALLTRDPVSAFFSNVLWGHDATELPINGLVWYPAQTDEPMPVALIVHGNHAAGDFSDPGYAYLGEHLASHGVFTVSVDENYLNGDAFFDYGGAEQGVRAWMLLRHLEQLATWNADPLHPLFEGLDLERVALIGHSRGGEAASVAAMLEAGDQELNGMPPVPRGFGIRAVVGIAPSDAQYGGPGAPARLTDIDYLVLQGAHDADLPAFSGLTTYHRVTYTGGGDHLKAAVYSQRANHGRFNSVWDIGDAGPLLSWQLDRGSILSPDEQQDLAKGVIGAFLQRSLFGETGYDAFFREPRAGRAWLPDDVVLTQWQTSDRTVLADFTYGIGEGTTTSGFDEARMQDPMLRDETPQGDHALHLTWSGPSHLTVEVEPGSLPDLGPDASLVLSLAAADERELAPTVDLELADGRHFGIAMTDVTSIRPRLPTRLWKVDALGARYLPEEQLAWPAERFLQTYAIPLAAVGAEDGVNWSRDLARVTVTFGGDGDAILDDLGFEPG